MVELINSRDALCDKVTLFGIRVCDFWSIEDLEKRGIVTVHRSNSAGVIFTDRGEAYSSLTLGKCALFDAFRVRCGRKDGYPYAYSRLELSIDRGDGAYNLNCWTIAEVKERLNEVERYLSDEYGILVDMDCTKLKTIEINKTIELDEEYPSYLRPLTTLQRLLPKSKQKNAKTIGKAIETDQAQNNDPHKSFYGGNSGEKLKMYDKSDQINDRKKKKITSIKREATKERQTSTPNNWDEINERANKEIMSIAFIDGNYLRVELTLSSTKIKEVFGTNLVGKIDDESINDYFRDWIERNVRQKWELFQEKRQKKLKKVIKEEWKKDEYAFIENLLLRGFNNEDQTGLPLMMDVSEVQPLLKTVIKNDRNKRYRIYKRLNQKCSQKYGEKFVKNDEKKTNEIVEKLSQNCRQ